MIEDGMRELKPGSRAWLDCVKLLADIERKYRAERSARGIDSPNLGVALKSCWVWVAHIAADNSTYLEETTKEKLPGVIARRAALAAKQLRKAFSPEAEQMREELDAEYMDDVPRKARTTQQEEEEQ